MITLWQFKALSHDCAAVCRVNCGELDGLELRARQVMPTSATQMLLASSVLHETAQLSSMTREHPHDVSAWLAYAAHQPRALAAAGTVPTMSDSTSCRHTAVEALLLMASR